MSGKGPEPVTVRHQSTTVQDAKDCLWKRSLAIKSVRLWMASGRAGHPGPLAVLIVFSFGAESAQIQHPRMEGDTVKERTVRVKIVLEECANVSLETMAEMAAKSF